MPSSRGAAGQHSKIFHSSFCPTHRSTKYKAPRHRHWRRGAFLRSGARSPTPSRGRAHPPTRCHRGAGAAHLACQERADHRQLPDRKCLGLHLRCGLHGRLQPAGHRHAGMASSVSNGMTETHDSGAGQDGEGNNSRAEHIDSPVGVAAAHGGNPWPWRAVCQSWPAPGRAGSDRACKGQGSTSPMILPIASCAVPPSGGR